MNFTELFLTAFSLSLDAVAIALAAGARHPMKQSEIVKIAFFFGGFQLAMPLIGWLFGLGFKEYVFTFGHVISFMLLFGVGAKMLYESYKEETPEDVKIENKLHETKILISMAFATSIDALVIGITFNFSHTNIPIAISIIGAVTFALSYSAVLIGKLMKHTVGNKIELLGAYILIALAFKVLLY